MARSRSLRVIVLWLVLAAAALASRRVHAGEDADDPPLVAADAHESDFTPPDPGPDLLPARSRPIWLRIAGTIALPDTGKRSFGAMVLVGMPLGAIADRKPSAAERLELSEDASKKGSRAKSAEPPSLEPAAHAPRATPMPAPEDPKLTAPAPDASVTLPIPVVITPEVARGAVRAAIRRAKLEDSDARLDAIVARSRAAALLPDLRLRTMRVVDESQSRSPTSYDPDRVTASGGAALYLEARLGWRLDRVLFPSETLAVERLRGAREEARARLTARVLSALFDWQKARAIEASPTATPEEHLAASLEVLETEATLDLLTEGWFAAWQQARASIDRPKPARASATRGAR
jgi:hypothetical protein